MKIVYAMFGVARLSSLLIFGTFLIVFEFSLQNMDSPKRDWEQKKWVHFYEPKFLLDCTWY